MPDSYSEGKTSVLHTGAFLNAQARLSRDVSIALAKALAPKKASVLDATAATGIRGIRYCKEAGAAKATLLEINATAFKDLRRNVRANRTKGASMRALNTSVQEFANTVHERFDVVDLDPFGSAAPYLYDLMKVVKDGTLLSVTATDTALLCGAHQRACLRVYDAWPMHNVLSHETGLRILIGYVARTAAQFDFGIEVKLAFTYLHYMRAIVVVKHGARAVDSALHEMGYAMYCAKCCNAFHAKGALPQLRKCGFCGAEAEASGRLWLGNLYSDDARKALATYFRGSDAPPEEKKFADALANELDTPMYYSIPKLTKSIGAPSASPVAVMEALRKMGYKASGTHLEKSCMKTDAPIGAIRQAVAAVLGLQTKNVKTAPLK